MRIVTFLKLLFPLAVTWLVMSKNNHYRHTNKHVRVSFKEMIETRLSEKHGLRTTSTNSQQSTEDYCTSGGEVCVYNKICYEVSSKSWQTTSSKKHERAPLLSNRGKRNPDESDPYSQCNTEFIVEKVEVSPYDSEKTLRVEGPTYLVCFFIHHFGEILTNIMVSVFHSIWEIGMGDQASSFNFLLEHRITNKGSVEEEIPFSMFDAVSGHNDKTLNLMDLVDYSELFGYDHVCFEKLVSGMYRDSLVSEEFHPDLQLKLDMLDTFRDQMSLSYPATRENMERARNKTVVEENRVKNKYFPPECTITLLRRDAEVRNIENEAEIIELVKDFFPEDHWNLQVVAFNTQSFEEQYLTMQSAMTFISVSGTGSHMAMFLPDGATTIEIAYYNWNEPVNRYICAISPWLLCLTVDNFLRYGSTPEEFKIAKKSNIVVSLHSLRQELEIARKRQELRCLTKWDEISTIE